MNKLEPIAILLLLVACAPNQQPSDGQLHVVATTTILGDVVSVVGGEHIHLDVLLPAGSDPHTFEPAPRDAALISDADLLVVNGLGLETFLEPLLTNAADTQILVASDGIEPLEAVHEDEHSEEDGHEHETDPHVWQDPANVIVWAENIASTLAELDPAHAAEYQAKAAGYVAELEALDTFIGEQVSVLPVEQRILVTDHEALGYFAVRYDFEIIGVVIPSVSTLGASSAQDIAALQQTIQEHAAPAIFVGASANPDQVAQLAADLDIEIVTLYVEALSAADEPAPTYLEMMRYNVEAIVSALR